MNEFDIGFVIGMFAALAFGAAVTLIICKLCKASPKASYITAAVVSFVPALGQINMGAPLIPLTLWGSLAGLLYWGYLRASVPKQ